MTIIFTAATPGMIVMTADSAVTLSFQDRREYEEGNKLYVFSGIGCVATWGARDGNQPGSWLRERLSKDEQTVNDLADLVYYYLSNVYQPGERGADDVGFHVTGFTDGQPRLFHTFYGFDRPRPADQKERTYKLYDHSRIENGITMLYNGRNDLADIVVRNLLSQIERGDDVRYDLRSSVGLVQFSDFVARFAAELTPEVGPPFTTVVISHDNRIKQLRNNTFAPLEVEEVRQKLEELGIEPTVRAINLRLEIEGSPISGDTYTSASGIAPPE